MRFAGQSPQIPQMKTKESDISYNTTAALHPDIKANTETGSSCATAVGQLSVSMFAAEEPQVNYHQQEDHPIQTPIPEDRFQH